MYESSKRIKVESRFNCHVACPNAENVHAASKVRRSYV
jgi:hypothetical protein